jgi:hypothetical protein
MLSKAHSAACALHLVALSKNPVSYCPRRRMTARMAHLLRQFATVSSSFFPRTTIQLHQRKDSEASKSGCGLLRLRPSSADVRGDGRADSENGASCSKDATGEHQTIDHTGELARNGVAVATRAPEVVVIIARTCCLRPALQARECPSPAEQQSGYLTATHPWP